MSIGMKHYKMMGTVNAPSLLNLTEICCNLLHD